MQQIEFYKMHGNGNDFIIIDNRNHQYQINHYLIKKMSDRHFGIGCDQLIILESTSKADVKMQIYNSDGSKANACGNATRCVARLLSEENHTHNFQILIGERILSCQKINTDGNVMFAVNMGRASFEWQDIPLTREVDTLNFDLEQIDKSFKNLAKAIILNVGNPHIVIIVDNFNLNMEDIANKIQNNSLFIQGVNVNFAKILSNNSNEFELITYERGAGKTLSCGSGACATFYGLFYKKMVDSNVVTKSTGGNLYLHVDHQDIIMQGEAVLVFKGEVYF